MYSIIFYNNFFNKKETLSFFSQPKITQTIKAFGTRKKEEEIFYKGKKYNRKKKFYTIEYFLHS